LNPLSQMLFVFWTWHEVIICIELNCFHCLSSRSQEEKSSWQVCPDDGAEAPRGRWWSKANSAELGRCLAKAGILRSWTGIPRVFLCSAFCRCWYLPISRRIIVCFFPSLSAD
jgi:hypothetical protein